MKNETRRKKPRKAADELRSEYDFDYSKAKPNRFAGKVPKDSVVVVLDPDVAKVFESSESVNSLLRSVISAVKPGRK